MQLAGQVTVRYVEIETDEEYLAWRAGLSVLLEVLERYHRNQSIERANAVADDAVISLPTAV